MVSEECAVAGLTQLVPPSATGMPMESLRRPTAVAFCPLLRWFSVVVAAVAANVTRAPAIVGPVADAARPTSTAAVPAVDAVRDTTCGLTHLFPTTTDASLAAMSTTSVGMVTDCTTMGKCLLRTTTAKKGVRSSSDGSVPGADTSILATSNRLVVAATTVPITIRPHTVRLQTRPPSSPPSLRCPWTVQKRLPPPRVSS